MRKKYVLPDEEIEPEIARELTIPLLEVNLEDFEAFIRPSDIEHFSEGNKKVLLGISVLEQQCDFLLYAALLHNRQLRQREASQIRQKKAADKELERERQDRWTLGIIKWAATVVGAALLVWLVNLVLGKK